MTTFVVPDAHGAHEQVGRLLERAGIIDAIGRRVNHDVRVVQLGDLCNCTFNSIEDDLRCLERIGDWIDVYLVGNHEHPYFGGPPFAGFHRNHRIDERLMELSHASVVQPSIAVDGVLVTHAGVSTRDGYTTADEADRNLRERWEARPQGRPFSRIGSSRGGWDVRGGPLWADWSEPKCRKFSQVVGHTPGKEPRWRGAPLRAQPFLLCLDVGGKRGTELVGAWLRDGAIELVDAR